MYRPSPLVVVVINVYGEIPRPSASYILTHKRYPFPVPNRRTVNGVFCWCGIMPTGAAMPRGWRLFPPIPWKGGGAKGCIWGCVSVPACTHCICRPDRSDMQKNDRPHSYMITVICLTPLGGNRQPAAPVFYGVIIPSYLPLSRWGGSRNPAGLPVHGRAQLSGGQPDKR